MRARVLRNMVLERELVHNMVPVQVQEHNMALVQVLGNMDLVQGSTSWPCEQLYEPRASPSA